MSENKKNNGAHMFRNIFKSSPMGIHMYSMEPDDRLVFSGTNPAADRILNIDCSLLIGKTIEEAFPPLAETEVPQRYRDAAAKGKPWSSQIVEYEDERISGVFEIFAFQTSPGNMAVMFSDVTEAKAKEEALLLTQFSLDNFSDAVYWLKKDGSIAYANKKACSVLNYSQEELLAMSVWDVDVNINKKIWIKFWTELKQKGSKTLESEHSTKEGHKFPVEILAKFMNFKGEEYNCAFAHDITERVKKEKVQDSLYKISEAVQSAENLQELFRAIHEIIIEIMPAKNNFYIALYDEQAEMLSFPYFVDEFDEAPKPKKPGKGLTEYVLRKGKPLLASPEVYDRLEKKGEVISIGKPSVDWLGVPLITKDKTIGILVVQSYTEGLRYTEEEKNVLTFISEQVAMAITHKQAEDTIRESEELFRSVIENSHNTIFIGDENSKVVYMNNKILELTGHTPQELIGTDFTRLLDKESLTLVHKRYLRRQKGYKVPPLYEFNIVRKDGEKRRVEISSSIIHDRAGKTQTVAQARDITERVKMEEDLRQSEHKYKDLVEKADIAIIIDDRKGKYQYINKTFTDMFGYTQEDLPHLKITTIVHPDDIERIKKIHKARMEGKKSRNSFEFKGLTKSGEEIFCEADVVLLREEKKIYGTRSYIRDITERKQNEIGIAASLQEKEVLLREIHHRVKNNLQVISSLLSLQSQHIKDEATLNMFTESRRRVRSMGIVHEKLYRSENLSRVNFKEYLQSLTRHLFQVYSIDPKLIKLSLDVQEIYLDINTAIPCGLLVSELISNALKHAFPPGSKGEIYIAMSKTKRKKITLEVRDNGIGFDSSINIEELGSFGLQLVDLLTKQLQGNLFIRSQNSTSFKITFTELKFQNDA